MYGADEGDMFGWYSANVVPTYKDYSDNGQFCKSGIAFPVDN